METNQSVWNCVFQLLYRLQLLIRHIILVQIFRTSRWHRETRNPPVWWDSEKLGGRFFWSFSEQDITGPVSIVHHVRLPCIEHIGTAQIARENQNWKVFWWVVIACLCLYIRSCVSIAFSLYSERFSTMCDGRVASGLSKQWFVDNAEILKHLRLKTAIIIHNYPILSLRLLETISELTQVWNIARVEISLSRLPSQRVRSPPTPWIDVWTEMPVKSKWPIWKRSFLHL